MAEHKLDCCVVRDLLPAYIEKFTETETSAQVADHLENCTACQAVERDMRTQVPVEKAPKGALNFLKRVKRTRLLAAALSVMLTLWCMWWLYDQEFHWKEDSASLTLALEEHVGWTDKLEKAELQVLGVLEDQRELTVAFAAPGGTENVCGAAYFHRGLNGQYRFMGADFGPMPFTGGVYAEPLDRDDGWERTYLFMGVGCREIYAFQTTFDITELGGGKVLRQETLTFPVDEAEFVLPVHTSQVPHGEDETVYLSYPDKITLLDKDAQDVTSQHRDAAADSSWSSGIGVAEQNMVYVFMAIVALLGVVFIRYFLRRD